MPSPHNSRRSEPDITLVNGSAVPEDRSHEKLKPNGQQEGYVVLSVEERAKGFVRPVRHAYIHVGAHPQYATRRLTDGEQERYAGLGYVAYEAYPPGQGNPIGRFWTQAQLDSGCGTLTTMGPALAETYARDPGFYSGTFCSHCASHFPVGEKGEFVWADTTIRVGT